MSIDPYICVGGIGGSGTRVIAMILASLGLNMGNDLNEAFDNLTFTLLFKRKDILDISDTEFNQLRLIYEKLFTNETFNKKEIKLIYSLIKKDRPGHPSKWLKERVSNLINKTKFFENWLTDKNVIDDIQLRNKFKSLTDKLTTNKLPIDLNGLWGWKEPNTHVILERMLKYYSNMKYIHVMRNGLDMAFSNNQNQVLLWGRQLLKKSDFKNIHNASLKYWCLVTKKIIKLGKMMGSDRFLLINFDKLCSRPSKYLKKICNFLNISKKAVRGLKYLIEPPSNSIGKFCSQDLSIFDLEDILYVKKLGFNVTCKLKI
jgi:hypothetical protein